MDLPEYVRGVYRTDTAEKTSIAIPLESASLEEVLLRAKSLGALLVVKKFGKYHLKYLSSNTDSQKRKLMNALQENLIAKKYHKRVSWLIF